MLSSSSLAVSRPCLQNQCGQEVNRAAGQLRALSTSDTWTRLTQHGQQKPSRALGSALPTTHPRHWPITQPQFSQFLPQISRLLNQRAHWIHGSQILVSEPEARPSPAGKSKHIQFNRLRCSHFWSVKGPFFLGMTCDVDNSNCFLGVLFSKVRN